MRITVTQFVTLDGVSQGPGSATEDTSDGFDRGGWLVPYIDEVFVRQTSDWLDLADGLLLGRRTYQAFARDWPAITDPADPFTGRMNALPKYVVSNSLTDAGWHPTTILSGDPIERVARLRAEPGRELQVHGSSTLADALLSRGLVDTLRLAVAPTVIRTGRRLLAAGGEPNGLSLRRHQATPSGLLLLEYETAGQAPRAEYEGVAAFTEPR